MNLFSVETIFFTFLDYPMSYLEFFGTILTLWSVWLVSQRNMLTWPIGIIAVLLFMLLFYQIQLYSDALEQVYYIGASLYGWWYWKKNTNKENDLVDVNFSPKKNMMGWIGMTILASIILGLVMTKIHLWIPKVFTLPADFPFLDAITTVMSFVAMWLMARKRIESWIYWVSVDVIAIGLYFSKGIYFVSLLYAVLLILASRGFWTWYKAHQKQTHGQETDASSTH